jgi:EmrB/QacA subfamily drug resistance transporter
MTEAIRITPRERNITLAAIMVVFLLSALDNTIVSTAMPRIISDLEGLNLYTWVTTAYLLASTVMVPIYGKLSDIYGRKPILITGIIIFLLGSILSGMAGEFGALPLLGGGMTQLIIFRGVQGLGGAALFTSAFAVIADLIPPRDRGKYQGLFGGVFGLASVLGPIIGGFFTDLGTVTLFGYAIAGWRWIFYVNLPLGLFALYLIGNRMPRLGGGQPGRIDYPGALLVITTFVPLLLGLTWGGSVHAWTSPLILGLLGGSLASLLLFIFVELRSSNPILPLELFRNPVFTAANAAAFVLNIAFLGVVMFLPLFMQLVLGISATNSGFTLLPLMAGLIGSSAITGLLVSKTGRYKIFMLAGSAVLLAGLWLLTQISLETTSFDLGWRMIIVGIGLGPAQSLFTLAVQNAVPRQQLGTATSASQFFRQIGSTIGLAVFGTLLTFYVGQDIPRRLPDIPALQEQKFDIGALNQAGADAADLAARLKTTLDALFTRVSAALQGDDTARAELLASPETPQEVKDLLAQGSTVPAGLILPALRTRLEEQAEVLAGQLERGIRLGFTDSIRKLFLVGFWITLGGAVIVVFIPELPLRTGSEPEGGSAG